MKKMPRMGGAYEIPRSEATKTGKAREERKRAFPASRSDFGFQATTAPVTEGSQVNAWHDVSDGVALDLLRPTVIRMA